MTPALEELCRSCRRAKTKTAAGNAGSGRQALIALIVLVLGVELAGAQDPRQQTNIATLDPSEERNLNTIFQRWRVPPQNDWNISGVICSGAAIDDTPVDNWNPGIKCDCSFQSNTTCHITAMRVYALDIQGELPDELWNLTYLTILYLGQNYLTGPLSPSIGNLTRLQYLSLGINALSGQLPGELGLLTDLRLLAFGGNSFSGPLPPELGNLTRVQQIYIDSSGFSGPIPARFAALQSLEVFAASDNEFTGRIPDFIGSWSGLTTLRLQGNSFQGPIPSSIARLNSLRDLRISDLLNGSSSLGFLGNMTYLSTLVLRNNNISGPIPLNIRQYRALRHLDLSFNNLSGPIPDTLFNLSSLNSLYLGNNRLNGELPAQKSSFLVNIDLSYNELSGRFPSWISRERDLQINLVGNNFTTEDSNSSGLASGLNCLQRNFPCNRRSPISSNFAINCGGPPIRALNGIAYDGDNLTLGPATFYMATSGRWAFSNAGLAIDLTNPEYTSNSSSPIPNTLDSQLFQTTRISASSLRYYGLGLQNGNYTVNLQFAESAIENPPTWRSLGRRVFDIYVQGDLVEKDFDIRREAGNSSFRVVQRVYQVQVLENYLEIHLFWAGKGTCCIPRPATYGPSISAISVTSDSEPAFSSNPTSRRDKTGLIVGIVVGVGVASFLSLIAVIYFIRRAKRQQSNEDKEFLGMDAAPYTFPYTELRDATNDFNPSNKLGEGGFGSVYKGSLADGRVVAVKQLSVASNHGKLQFMAEIATISAVQHRNLVTLHGCCIEGDKRLLVYEYLENRSLDQALFGSRSLKLDWATRFAICLGVARGLAYLHEESRFRIVHRDVKASNILLDSELVPKISDFGLAKLYDDKKTHISTRIAGTIGYLAPEYALRGHLTEKADVFGFGVVALEVVSGRANSDPSLGKDRIYLLEWAWQLHENNQETDLVDTNLLEFNKDEVKKLIGVSLLCTQTLPTLRPSMSRVVGMLSGDIEVAKVTSRPIYLTDWNYDDKTFTSSNDSQIDNGPYRSSSSNTTADSHPSPGGNDAIPMLLDAIGEHRT